MSYVQDKHDIGLLRTDGSTKVGFILARKNGVPLYETYDDEYLTRHQTPTAGYDALPPEKEFAISQDDWRAGFGLETYDTSDPRRYHKSLGMDLRHKGMGILSWGASSIAVPATATEPTYVVLNPGFENWTTGAPDNWTEDTGGSQINQEAGTVQAGSSAVVMTPTAGTTSCILYQNFSNPTEWIGYKLTVSCYSYHAAGDFTARTFALFRNGVSVASTTLASGAAWNQATTPEYSVPAATTSLQIRLTLTYSAASPDIKIDTISLSYTAPVAKGAPTAFAEFNDKFYVAFGKFLYKLNGTGDGWTIVMPNVELEVYGFSTAITDLEPFVDSRLYVGQGASTNYWYMDTAEAFTQSDSKALLFRAVGNTLWKALLARSVYSATAPTTDAGWSTATAVDSATFDILEMISDGATLVIKKEDRVFYIDSAGAVKIYVDEVKHLAADTSGKSATFWQGKYYFGYGKQSLVEYDAGTISWRSPAKWGTNIPEFVGKVQAVTGDEEYLLAVVNYGTKLEILAGRLETIGTTTSWVWHPYQEITLTDCEVATVSSVYQKRLWIGSTAVADNVFYIPLPTGYGDITADGNRSFLTGGLFETSKHHANFKGDKKAFIKIIAELGHAYNANIYYECHYKKAEDTAWTDAGDLIGTSSNRIATLYFPVDASSNNPQSITFQLKFVGITNVTTTTPILKSYVIKGILYPTRRDLIYCIVRCADEIKLNDGSTERDNDAAHIKATLEEAKNDATWPITFYDIDASTIYVRMLPTTPFSRLVKDEVSGNVERYFYLLLQKVALS